MHRQFCHFLHFHAGEAKVFDDFAQQEIDAVAAEGIGFEALGEMRGVEKVTVFVQESAERHGVAPNGAHPFVGNIIAQHAHGAAQMVHHVGGVAGAAVVGFQELERRQADGEFEQLQFVVNVFNLVVDQGGDFPGGQRHGE